MMALLAGKSLPVEERCLERLGKLGGADQSRSAEGGRVAL